MSPSPEVPKRLLFIQTSVPTVELYVISGSNDIVARGVGSLQEKLTPGIYKLRLRVGDTVADRIFELPPGQEAFTLPISAMPQIPMTTPVPLAGPGQAAPASADVAHTWSKAVHVAHGAGSRLFFFVAAPPSGSMAIAPATLTLRTFDGVQIASLAQGSSAQGCLGCSVELNPGGYVLRVERGMRSAIEQAVYTCAGWQTQVFLQVAQWSEQNVVDLSGCSVLMSRIERGFLPGSQEFLWIEAARKSLDSGRVAMAPGMIQNMLYGKFDDPMLGIYGAHLLVARNEPADLPTVVKNLTGLIGPHPDVTSLYFYFNKPLAAALTYPYPPMLTSSWALIVQHSAENPGVVPSGSFSARIAGSLWPTGTWLGWKAADPKTVDAAPTAEPADWNFLWKVVRAGAVKIANADLTPVERSLMSYMSQRGKQATLLPSKVIPESLAPGHVSEDTPQTITSATGIPYSVILDAAASLSKKLK